MGWIARALWLCLASIAAWPQNAASASRPASSPLDALAALQQALFAKPFYAVFSLQSPVVRDGPILVRLHGRAPGHVLIQLDGPPRVKGNVILMMLGRMHLWFPRAELHLEIRRGHESIPSLVAGLDWSDFTFPGGNPADWRADPGPSRLGARTMRCVPAANRPGLGGRLEIECNERGEWVRSTKYAADGSAERTWACERDGRTGWPRRMRILAPGDPSRDATLECIYFEANPPIADSLFLPESLTLWR
jgi:hypothetical protein